jgi:membrane protein
VNGEGGWHRTVTGVVRRTLEAAYEDNIPFLAGALSFDILLTAIPFVGLVLAVVSHLVDYQLAVQQLNVHELLQRFLPDDANFGFIERALGDLVARRGRLTILAVPLFLWFSTRMFGGLRAALNEVFDTEENRPWPVAKLTDLAMVFVAGALFLANAFASTSGSFFSYPLSLLFSTLLFFVIFKFAPSRRIYWRTSLVASLFCAVGFEIAKRLYALYVSSFVTFDRVASDANLIGILLFFLWIYYTAYMFLLGGGNACASDEHHGFIPRDRPTLRHRHPALARHAPRDGRGRSGRRRARRRSDDAPPRGTHCGAAGHRGCPVLSFREPGEPDGHLADNRAGNRAADRSKRAPHPLRDGGGRRAVRRANPAHSHA